MWPATYNNNNDGAVILITGTSSGIGKACATYLVEKGYTVYGASRQDQPPSEKFIPLKMDVRDDRSVQQGVERILEREGKIDVVINNAGIGFAGSVEDSSIEEVKAQFETNFYGTFRVCKAVLPTMRSQEAGLIINISSIMGLIALPYQALYSASKFAIEGMTEGLRMEVKKFGVNVLLVEPGDFKTNFVYNRIKTKNSQNNSVYKKQFNRVLSTMEQSELNAASPRIVAAKVYKILQHKSPKTRYVVGSFTEKLAASLKNVIPSNVFEWLLGINYKM